MMAHWTMLGLCTLVLAMASVSPPAVGNVNLNEEWQVFTLGDSCFFYLETDNKLDEDNPPTLYATKRLELKEVTLLRSLHSENCTADNSWLLSTVRPNLPSYEDYMEQFSANITDSMNSPLHRTKRSTNRQTRRNRPSRMFRVDIREKRRDPQNGRKQQGGTVSLSNGPYISSSFNRQNRNGQRFRHYRAFNQESGGRSQNTPATHSTSGNTRGPQREYWRIPRRRNYLLRKSNEIRNSEPALRKKVQRIPQSYKRQAPSDTLSEGLQEQYLDSGAGHLEELDHPPLPHDRRIVPSQEPSDLSVDYDEIFNSNSQNSYDYHNALPPPPTEDNSLIFSQALGSTGDEGGTFQAEAEGLGDAGERTYTSVDGGSRGSSALASAANANQQAIAHARVDGPAHDSGSPNSDVSSPLTANGMSASEIEQMMKNNGITGFALATVNARGKNGEHSSSHIGNMLPGLANFQTGNSVSNNYQDGGIPAQDDTHTMVNNIMEEVHDPSHDGVFIDDGGLVGGAAGDLHRESEFQQIPSQNLQEGGTGPGISGPATYSQNTLGNPPYDVYDYPAYYEYDRYDFNHPLYFPDVDYREQNNSIGQGAVDVGALPSDLNTGIQYPIIEGDVPHQQPNEVDSHMIIDDSLQSYFPHQLNSTELSQPDLFPEDIYQPTASSNLEREDSESQQSKSNLDHYSSNILTGGDIEPVTTAPIYNPYENIVPDESPLDSSDISQAGIQPAYNSYREYERNRLSGLPGSQGSPHPFDSYRPVFPSEQPTTQPTSKDTPPPQNGYDEYTYDNLPYDPPFEPSGDFDGHREEYHESGYESSFETSSQSSSHLYTSSHHYSYQHGQDGNGIGNSIHTILTQPSQNITISNFNNEDSERPEDPVTPQPVQHSAFSPPLSSHEPRFPLPPISPTFPPRVDSNAYAGRDHHMFNMPSIRPSHPSASQGVENMPNMQVLTPGGIGTSRFIKPDNPNLEEIKVVMSGTPAIASSSSKPGKVFLPGEKVPGSSRYIIPEGFRARVVLSDASASSSHMSPNAFMQSNANANIVAGGNGHRGGMHLSSSSSASSSGSGYAVSSSSSARMAGHGSLSATSSSSSHRVNNGHNQNQPAYFYQQSFDTNPRDNSYKGYNGNNQQGMRTDARSSWTPNQIQRGNNIGRGMSGYQQNLRQSSYSGGSNDCGFFSMRCNIMQSHMRQNEICIPIHVVMPCCC